MLRDNNRLECVRRGYNCESNGIYSPHYILIRVPLVKMLEFDSVGRIVEFN